MRHPIITDEMLAVGQDALWAGAVDAKQLVRAIYSAMWEKTNTEEFNKAHANAYLERTVDGPIGSESPFQALTGSSKK